MPGLVSFSKWQICKPFPEPYIFHFWFPYSPQLNYVEKKNIAWNYSWIQNISWKQNSLTSFFFFFNFSYRYLIFFFLSHIFFYCNSNNTRINWILPCFFHHHQQNNNLHSNCNCFIIHDQSERTLSILKSSIKFQGSQCERGGCGSVEQSWFVSKNHEQIWLRRQKESPQDHFIKHFSRFFCAVSLWIREITLLLSTTKLLRSKLN